MAVQHIVVAKFKSSVDKATKDKAFETVKGLLGQIPVAKGVVVGPPLSNRSTQGYDYGMTATFEAPEAFGIYLKHPKHVEVMKLLGPFLESVISYQINIGATTGAKL